MVPAPAHSRTECSTLELRPNNNLVRQGSSKTGTEFCARGDAHTAGTGGDHVPTENSPPTWRTVLTAASRIPRGRPHSIVAHHNQEVPARPSHHLSRNGKAASTLPRPPPQSRSSHNLSRNGKASRHCAFASGEEPRCRAAEGAMHWVPRTECSHRWSSSTFAPTAPAIGPSSPQLTRGAPTRYIN